MSISDDKRRIAITLPVEKVREFKIKAAQADLTLSEYISRAGTVTQLDQVVTQKPMNSLPATVTQKMAEGIKYSQEEDKV